TTEAVRRIRGLFIDQPKPLTREDYNWLMEWTHGDRLVDLSSAASFIVEEDDIEAFSEESAARYDAIYNALAEKLRAGELVGGESIFDVELDSSILIRDGTI